MILGGPVELTEGDAATILGFVALVVFVVVASVALIARLAATVGHLIAGHRKPWRHSGWSLLLIAICALVTPIGLFAMDVRVDGETWIWSTVIVALAGGALLGWTGEGASDEDPPLVGYLTAQLFEEAAAARAAEGRPIDAGGVEPEVPPEP